MPFAGLDIHKRIVQAVLIADDGAILRRERFDCTRDELTRFAQQHLGEHYRVALEATTNTWSVVDALRPLVGEVVVSNPLRTRAIAEAKVKTDKVDALVLAQLLRADYLPRVWQPDAHTQRIRRQCSRRASLVSDRTRIKNRLHAVLHQRLIKAPVADLFSVKGRAWLATLELDAEGRAAIESELRLLERIESEVDASSKRLAVEGYDDPHVRLLITLPGVDVTVAQTVLAALGDIQRFRDADHAASYLGLVPSTHQSADRCYHGRITKQGNSHARWLLVQAAQHLSSHPGPLGVFFRRLAHKKNRNVAVVATARKLVTIAWHMLKNNEPYRYAIPRTVDTKLAKLRVQATGERKAGGVAKGSKRSANYGKGGVRTIPALDTIYQREGLPEIQPLKPAEQLVLRAQRVATFAGSVRKAKRVPKPKSQQKKGVPTLSS